MSSSLSFAKMMYSPFTNAFTYRASGWMERPIVERVLHGVVVQARTNVGSFSFSNLNFQMTDKSSTSLYPCVTSKLLNGVTQRGQMCMGLCPSYRRFFLYSSEKAHHILSMYSASMVR